MIAPKLRFSEFKDEWRSEKISEIANVSSGSTPNRNNPSYWNGDIPWITTSLINFNTIEKAEEFITKEGLKNSSTKLYPKNTILMAMYGQGVTRGKVAILGIEATTNQACASISLKPNFNVNFIFQNLSKRYEEIRDLSNDGGQKNLSGSIIKEISISYPTEKEQTKIAEFLSAVDDKISQLNRELELLNQYKKGVMQKIFSQEIRFKNENGEDFGEWETTTLDNFLTVSKLKNKELTYSKNEVLSVSGELGIVNQIELLGRSYAGVSVAPYGIVEYGDIVYTKSPLKSNPYGIIKANKGKAGIVSTLYAVYKCNDNILPNLLDYYFQSDIKLNNYLRPLVRKGAKNDMKVNNQDVLNGVVCFPNSRKEQKIIIEFLTAIDERIDHTTAQLTHTKQWKKGLLQQMFV